MPAMVTLGLSRNPDFLMASSDRRGAVLLLVPGLHLLAHLLVVRMARIGVGLGHLELENVVLAERAVRRLAGALCLAEVGAQAGHKQEEHRVVAQAGRLDFSHADPRALGGGAGRHMRQASIALELALVGAPDLLQRFG